MAHKTNWRLVSIDTAVIVGSPLVTVLWQCVVCAVFMTEYATPQAPRLLTHEDSEEL